MKISRIQIEMINNAMAAYSKTEPSHPAITPLSVCVAMSIYWLRSSECIKRGIIKPRHQEKCCHRDHTGSCGRK